MYDIIKNKLEAKGYYISPNYGLILKKEGESDFVKMKGPVLADIRKGERIVVIPRHEDERETENEKDLMKVLSEDNLPFRNKPRTHNN